jgi:hypothetical protein
MAQHHTSHPFHHLQKWNGEFFEVDDLDNLGVEICLGHRGKICPAYNNPERQHHLEERWEDEIILDSHDAEHNAVDEEELLQSQGFSGKLAGSGGMIVVDVGGVFRRKVKPCICPNAPDMHLQLFAMDLFPATTKRPTTAFTFRVLDQFHVEAMECKTAALNFFSKLRRLTNPNFPSSVPVRCLSLYCQELIHILSFRTATGI